MSSKMKRIKILSFCILLIVPLLVRSLEITGGVSASAEHTDNALRSTVSPESELQKRAGATVNIQHEGQSVVVDTNYSAAYTSYDKGSQEDNTEVTGSASVVYEQIQSYLFWTVENTRRNVLADSQSVNLASNREDRSISSISPRLVLAPSSVDDISVSVSYVDVSYEESRQQNSERVAANLQWRHRLSVLDAISADLSFQDVAFEVSIFDYEYTLMTAGYEASLARLNYTIVAGYNQSKRIDSDVGGNYFNFTANYSASSSSVGFEFLQELTDTSRQNNNGGITDFSDVNNLADEIDIIERSSLQVNYSYGGLCELCTLEASVSYEEEDYETQLSDGEEFLARLRFGYRFNRSVALNLSSALSDYTFEEAGDFDDYTLLEYGVLLSQNINQSLSMSYGVSSFERSSDNGTTDYDELRAVVSFNYSFD